MRPRPFLLLIAGFTLALMVAGEADAKEPEWSYDNQDTVHSVAISADGQYTASGSADNKVYLVDGDGDIWSYTTGSTVRSVAISADGEYIVAGSADDRVYLFGKDSSTPLWNYTTGSAVASVAISADGEYIAAGSWDYKVYLFDKDSSTPLWSYETGDNVWSVAISADGEYIAAGSWDNKVYLFDKDSSTPLWSYTTGGPVPSIAISADGEYIAAGSWSGKVYLFGKDSNTPLWSYTTGSTVRSVAISADGEYIVAGSADDRVYLFGKDSSTPLWNYTTGGRVFSVAISADGEYIAAGSWDNKVYFFDKDSSTPLWSYTTEDDVWSVAISANGEYIVAGSGYRVYLFDKNVPPTAAIDSITPSPARFDAEVTFSGSGSDSDGDVVAYEWSSAIDGFLSDEEDFSITGLTVGTHTISFRVQDDDGEWSDEWDSVELEIYPNAPPVATIDSISPSPARFDAEIFFSGSGSDSDGTVVAYEWISSRDGFLSDEEDFSITGLSIGNHSITFRVQDNDGERSDWAYWSLVVNPNAPPDGTIDSISPFPAKFDEEVTFSSSSSDSDGTVVAYLWESSIDGELSTEANFSSNNLSLGHHTITFLVQDNDGDWSDSTSESLLVYVVPVAIAGEDLTTEVNKLIQFSGTGTDEDGSIVKYEWDFDGDGSYDLSSGDNGRTTNVYNNEGTFTAVLRVTDNDGFTNTDTVVITVTEKIIQIDDEGNVTVTDAGEDEEGIPSISLITALASIGLIAILRRK